MLISQLTTRIVGPILDLVITSSDSFLALSLSVTNLRCSPSDHFLHQTVCWPHITASSNVALIPPLSFYRYRFLSCWSIVLSAHNHPPKSLGSLLIAYNTTTVSSLLDKHAPVITRFSSRKSKSNPEFTSTLHDFNSTVRHAKNIWKRTHSALDWSSFKFLCNHNLILASKKAVLRQLSLFIFW